MGNQDQPGRLGAQVVAARQRAGDLAGRPIETGRMPVAAGGERGGDDRRLGYRDRLARVQPGTACGGLGAAGDLRRRIRPQRQLGIPDLDHAPVHAVPDIQPHPKRTRQRDLRESLPQRGPQRAQPPVGGPQPRLPRKAEQRRIPG